jgi:phenylpyruvate tautomerase PptA (4-oxalocrotonate tautomerase family)
MPMLDAYIPKGALTESAEANLFAALTEGQNSVQALNNS